MIRSFGYHGKKENCIFGKNLPFDGRFEHRCIDRITEETLENKKQFQIIIISDFAENLEIDDETFLFLKDRISSGKSDVYYLGRQYFSKLFELGLMRHPFGDDDYAVGMISYNGGVHNLSFWRTEDINATGNSMQSLCQLLISIFVNEIRERYGN